MKNTILIFSILIFIFTSCAKCKDDDPKARVLNKGTGSVDVQIKSTDGNIVSISDLASGSVSSLKEYSPGATSFKYKIEGVEKTETITLNTCTSYDISINSDNEIVMFSKKIK
ncbi:MAG TPA: hypothetical protein VKY37_10460 [Brumimicrobium sp.]|nr:hypothetical protein [Brumimicrobium sp.]